MSLDSAMMVFVVDEFPRSEACVGGFESWIEFTIKLATPTKPKIDVKKPEGKSRGYCRDCVPRDLVEHSIY